MFQYWKSVTRVALICILVAYVPQTVLHTRHRHCTRSDRRRWRQWLGVLTALRGHTSMAFHWFDVQTHRASTQMYYCDIQLLIQYNYTECFIFHVIVNFFIKNTPDKIIHVKIQLIHSSKYNFFLSFFIKKINSYIMT